MESSNVRMQALLAPFLVIIALLCCGHRSALPIALITLFGLTISLGFVGWYFFRANSKYKPAWRSKAEEGLGVIAAGLGLPLLAACIVVVIPSFRGILSGTLQATWIAVCIAILCTAIITSSMVDRFLVLPRVLGLWGRAIWVDPEPEDKHNRRLGQIWIAHRGLCEILSFCSLGVAMAIAITWIAHNTSNNEIISDTLNALGGTGVVIGVFSLASHRVSKALRFVLSGNVTLGLWYTSRHSTRMSEISGLAVAAAIEPGFVLIGFDDDDGKVITYNVDLGVTRDLRKIDPPATANERWRRDRVLEHVLKLDKLAKWTGP